MGAFGGPSAARLEGPDFAVLTHVLAVAGDEQVQATSSGRGRLDRDAQLGRPDALEPDWIHGMHGGSLESRTSPYFIRALREESVGYQGKLLGRDILPR